MVTHWCPSLVVIAVSEPCVRWQGVVPLLGSPNYIESLLAVDNMVAAARVRKEYRGSARSKTREVKEGDRAALGIIRRKNVIWISRETGRSMQKVGETASLPLLQSQTKGDAYRGLCVSSLACHSCILIVLVQCPTRLLLPSCETEKAWQRASYPPPPSGVCLFVYISMCRNLFMHESVSKMVLDRRFSEMNFQNGEVQPALAALRDCSCRLKKATTCIRLLVHTVAYDH